MAVIFPGIVKSPAISTLSKLIDPLILPNTFKDQVIAFSTRIPAEFNIHRFVDYETQFTKTFTDPLRFILESIGWKLEREATLESFFE